MSIQSSFLLTSTTAHASHEKPQRLLEFITIQVKNSKILGNSRIVESWGGGPPI